MKSKKTPPGTYETRFWADEHTNAALAEFADLFSRLERKLYVRTLDGTSAPSLKNEFTGHHRIPARLFNSLRVSLEGRMDSRKANLFNQKVTLERQVAKAMKVLTKVEKKGNPNQVHQKKRRLHSLRDRLASVERDISEDVLRLCFGSRKLFHSQFHLEANGYSSHEDWLSDWRKARSDSFFLLGSRDETSGNQMCVATVQEDGLLSLRVRVPDCLSDRYGKYLVIKGLHFNHGHHQVLAALDSCREYREYRLSHEGAKQSEIPKFLGQAVSYRFKLDDKGWRVFVTTKRVKVPVVTNRRLGAVGVDLNADHLAVAEVDQPGNRLESFSIPLATYGKSNGQASALTGDAVARLVAYAKSVGKPIAFEKLDFSQKRAQLEDESPRSARLLSSFACGRFREYLLSRAQRKGVEVIAVNPAFSSVIGRVKYMERYGLSVHQAAAMVLARRLLGCSEGVPSRGLVPLDGGGHVTLTLPARNRVRHVWTLWGALSGQLRPALAVRCRRGQCPPPALAPAGVASSSVIPGGIPGREPSQLLGRRRGEGRVSGKG